MQKLPKCFFPMLCQCKCLTKGGFNYYSHSENDYLNMIFIYRGFVGYFFLRGIAWHDGRSLGIETSSHQPQKRSWEVTKEIKNCRSLIPKCCTDYFFP